MGARMSAIVAASMLLLIIIIHSEWLTDWLTYWQMMSFDSNDGMSAACVLNICVLFSFPFQKQNKIRILIHIRRAFLGGRWAIFARKYCKCMCVCVTLVHRGPVQQNHDYYSYTNYYILLACRKVASDQNLDLFFLSLSFSSGCCYCLLFLFFFIHYMLAVDESSFGDVDDSIFSASFSHEHAFPCFLFSYLIL